MKDVFVNDFTFALGNQRFSLEETAAAGKTFSKAEMLKEAGFNFHHVCDAKTTAYDLARNAIQKISGSLGRVEAIVYATCLPENGNVGSRENFRKTNDVKHLMDFPASHLQAEFGLHRAVVVGLNQQACTGMLGSLQLARTLLVTEPDTQRALCVTADRFPVDALYEQSYNLISDGAAACVVSTEPKGFRLLAWHGITNGAMSQASDDETVGSYFNYTHRLIEEVLRKAKLTIRDIAWVVPQNTNRKAWQILSRLLPIDFERVYFRSMPEVAHLISGDNIVNLKYLDQEGRLRPGEKLLLVMAGYGLNWQCAILEKR